MAVSRALPAVPCGIRLAEGAPAPEDLEAAAAVLRSGWLTMGPRTMELEAALAARHAVPHAAAVSSDAAALHLALLALGAGPGDEVLVPGIGGAVAAGAVRRCGAVPVAVDVVGPSDLAPGPGDVLDRLGPRTRAVVTADPAGAAALGEACGDVPVVLHASGDLAAGRAAPVTCLALVPGGALGGDAAGAVVTARDDVAATVRSTRSHAMTSGTWARHTGRTDTYDVEGLGFNYRTDELRSVLALGRLQRADAAATRRAALEDAYRSGLERVAGAVVAATAGDVLALVLADPRRRDPLRAVLAAADVETAVPAPVAGAPVRAAAVQQRLVLLPLHAGLTVEDVGRVCVAVAQELAR